MAISKQQWAKVCMNLLGLRSEDNPDKVRSAASYAMDNGIKYNLGDAAPDDWMDLLEGTIAMMKAFPNSSTRYLMFVKHSTGFAKEYSNCFAKCSSMPVVVSSMPLSKPVDVLMEWVLEEINRQ